jgi:aminoglycoside phosphotransferase (APT) family kinase protein
LDEHAPGLAPRPLGLETDPPVVVMSRVAGDPLDTEFTPRLLASMLEAYRLLFGVPVPPHTPQRYADPRAFLRSNAAWIEEEHTRTDLHEVVRRALTVTRTWHADPPHGVEEIRDPVIAQGDGKVDNMLWDGSRVRLIDFEGFGVGDLAFEVADLAEHISARLRGLRDPAAVLAGFDLSPVQLQRAKAYRVVLATFWLLMLLPGNPGHRRNPEGSDRLQALHLLDLLARAAA